MEDQCRQQRKTSGGLPSGAGEEPQQNRWSACALNGMVSGSRNLVPIPSIYCCARIAANFPHPAVINRTGGKIRAISTHTIFHLFSEAVGCYFRQAMARFSASLLLSLENHKRGVRRNC